MNKVKMVSLFISFFALIIVLLMVNEVNAFQQEVKVDQGASYKDSHRSVFFLGEEAILDSAEDDEGEAFFWAAGFTWRGALSVTLDDVRVYSKDSAGFGNMLAKAAIVDDYYEQLDSAVLVVASFRIKNIDAVPASEDEQDFNASVFSMQEALLDEYPCLSDFGSASLTNATEKDLYRFYIPPGKEETIKLGWFVDQADLANDLNIAVGATGLDKYIFSIPSSSMKEGVE